MPDFYRIIQIDDNVFRITSYEAVFCEVIVGTDKALLIDTGYGFGDLKSAVERITDKPIIVLNTHGHVDHIGANCQFKGSVYIGGEDAALSIEHSGKEIRLKSAKNAEHAMDWDTGQEVYGLPDDFCIKNFVNCRKTSLMPLNEDMIFNLGGVTIKVFHTPGHTFGSYSFYYIEKKILYVGDAANPFLWLFMPEATDRQTHIRTLEKIITIQCRTIFGGHAPLAMSHDDVKLFIKVAEEADYSKGEPFFNPIVEAHDARVCCLRGMTLKDLGKPGFASIVLSSDR